ncbi:hypothetical protein EVG20_g8157 [Dentipellis fragilis]|uniref:Uncharacterized protein n=1 Tax=Dentipellis fragilis TaxID=205917 RepID=A0A4Y9Y8P7_9AGAM|nr:hypothetical protein EVG20_g8157 [Dentipellis fragilis]
MKYISTLLTASTHPCLYLDEIQSRLHDVHGVNISIACVSRAVCRLVLTHKQVSKLALELNKLLRSYGMQNMVVSQRSRLSGSTSRVLAVDDITNPHQDGWAAVGRACIRWTSRPYTAASTTCILKSRTQAYALRERSGRLRRRARRADVGGSGVLNCHALVTTNKDLSAPTAD